MGALVERWYPYTIGIVGGVVYWLASPVFPVTAEAAPNLFSAIISVAAIAVGFLATAKSIILSIDNRPLIVALKTTGHYSKLVNYLLSATIWSFLLAAMSIVCFLADLKSPAGWHQALFALWAVVMLIAAATCYRVIHVFGKVLRTTT